MVVCAALFRMTVTKYLKVIRILSHPMKYLILSYLFFDKVPCSHLESDIENGKDQRIPYDITHSQTSDEKIPHRRELKR